jgi:hypothetical protein
MNEAKLIAEVTVLTEMVRVLSDKVNELEAKQEQGEPVAWMDADGNVSDNNDHRCFPIPLYTK